MIPSSAQLEEFAAVGRGQLRLVPYAALLHALAVHRRTVALEIRRRQVVKTVIFERGVPVDSRSNLVHETLGRFLVAEGKLTEAQFTTTFSEAVKRGVRLGEVLTEHGLLSAYELYRLLQQNLAKKLLDPFTWEEGEFRLLPEAPQVVSPLKVNTSQLIFTGITRFVTQQEADAAAGSLVGRKLVLHKSPHLSLDDLRATPALERLTAVLDAPLGLSELAAATTLPFEEVTRLVYALGLLGLLVPEEDAAADTRPQPTVGVDTLPRPTPPPVGDDAGPSRDRVMKAYLSYRDQDPFDLLAVAEDAEPATIQRRYLAHARRFAPWRFESKELADKARDLFLAGADAYAQLADDRRRETLLYRRRAQREEQAPRGGQAPIETDLLDPEVHYRDGRERLEAGDPQGALQHLQFAADCDPQNGVYRSELAYCRYLLDPEHAAERSADELKAALRIDPGCALAMLYRGEILGRLGEWEEAEALLRRAVRKMAPDRRPIEALKELAAARKGKKR